MRAQPGPPVPPAQMLPSPLMRFAFVFHGCDRAVNWAAKLALRERSIILPR